jgi:hypothetical protein
VVPVNTLKNFTPVVGQTVLVHVLGTQLWALGPTMGSIVNADGSAVSAGGSGGSVDSSGILQIASADGSVTIQHATGPIVDLSVDSQSLVFNVLDYGSGVGLGTAADQAAVAGAITAAVNAGGGIVWFPVGVYLLTETINLPVSTTETTAPGNPPETAIYLMPPIRLTGAGGNAMPRGDAPTYGPIIQFKPSEEATMFNGVGEGTLEVDHLSFQDITPSYGASGVYNANLFFYVNNTTTNIHDCAFQGNNELTYACTDLIRYGPVNGAPGVTGNPRGDVGGIYQGQSSRLVNNSCTGMRHLALLYLDAADVLISGNSMYNTCGTNLASDAPIILAGPGCCANLIEQNDFELGTFTTIDGVITREPNGYAYAVMFYQAFQNVSLNNAIGDPYINPSAPSSYPSAQAAYWFEECSYTNGYPTFDSGAYQNTIIESGRILQPNPAYIPWGAGYTVAQQNDRAHMQNISGGAGGVIVGPELEAGDALFYMQAGTVYTGIGAGGRGVVNFPAFFPNGVVSVVVTSNGLVNGADSDINWIGQVFSVSQSGFEFYLNAYPEPQEGAISVSWIAVGF